MGKRIFFTVTNDLTYDQRMQRICSSLAAAGYDITLVGRKLPRSLPLTERPYKQKRINCWSQKGKWFYAEYNIRLLFFLLFKKMDAICAIDLDTILPCLRISKWKKIPRIYDAHELFTGLKEVTTRPRVLKAWTGIEKKTVPQFKFGYTVSRSIAEEFRKRYDVNYLTIRNVPVMREWKEKEETEKLLLYQGAVNEARGFEYLVPAMQWVNARLIICGDGNFMPQLQDLIKEYKVENKIVLKGMVPSEELWNIARQSYIALGIAENTGLNQYLALPNKFFDYIHAGLPQVTMDYPEYRYINQQFEVALLLENVAPERIAQTINNLLSDTVLYKRLHENCLRARQLLNWQEEEKKLVAFYKNIFNP